MKTQEQQDKHEQFVSFYIGEEEYAVSILQVREIIAYGVVTRVPEAPRCIRGVINLRGTVVPVVDLGVRFSAAPRPITKRTCIVITELFEEGGSALIGLVADAVSQVIDVKWDEVEPIPDFGTTMMEKFLIGMAKAGPRFILLLDIDVALRDVELMDTAASSESSEKSADGAEGAEGESEERQGKQDSARD